MHSSDAHFIAGISRVLVSRGGERSLQFSEMKAITFFLLEFSKFYDNYSTYQNFDKLNAQLGSTS